MNDADHTLSTPVATMAGRTGAWLGLTILWHPEPERIGQQCVGPSGAGTLQLSRFAPLFGGAGREMLALGHRGIARAPLCIVRDGADGVTLTAPDSRMAVELDGVPLEGALHLSGEQVARGAVLGLGGMVLICVHWMHGLPGRNIMPALVGVSRTMIALREQIRQVAHTNLPVLLLGETGTGKEVAARLLHAASERNREPFVVVNMAALNESLAAADLFGAVKGAYTGAQAGRRGLFEEADGGTLFLDEIGNTPALIQPMLLRVLEDGQYRPLGARANAQSNARLITATDQDLDAAGFNQALLRRLEGFVIRLPALRDRREDIGLLMLHFLQQWSTESGHRVELPMAFISAACNADWPGNVRQLAHVVRRAAMAVLAGGTPDLGVLLPATSGRAAAAAAAPLPQPPPERPTVQPRARPLRLSDLSDQAVVMAMENNGWKIRGAAQQLGISRPSLYKLLEAHPLIRHAADIPESEILQALAAHPTDLAKCASRLRTPGEALRQRLRAGGWRI